MSDHNFKILDSKKSGIYYIYPIVNEAWDEFFLGQGLKKCSFTSSGNRYDAYCKERPSEFEKINLSRIVLDINEGKIQPRPPKKTYAPRESKLGGIVEGDGEQYQIWQYGKGYAIYGIGYQEKDIHDALKEYGFKYSKGGETNLNTKPWIFGSNLLDLAIQFVRALNGHGEEGGEEEKPKVLKKGNVKYQRIVYEVELPHIGQRVIIKVDGKDDINTKVKSIPDANKDIVDLIVFESGHNAAIISGRWEILDYTTSYIDHTIIFK